MKPYDKLIINAAITGMVPMKKDTPHVPISVDEIIAEAKRCRDAGASILHIHARAADGQPDYRLELYEQIIKGIREACPDVLISGSTSGRLFGEFEKRSEVLRADPDFGSLTLGSLNFPNQASVNAPQMIKRLALTMLEQGVVPELEIFDLGMAEYSHYLIRKGILKPPFYANILLGNLGTLSATPFNLTTVVRALPDGTTWSAAGISRFQFPMNALAITMGGHVRVGLEDNIWFDAQRTTLATNVMLIDRVVGIAKAVGRDIASPTEASEMIGMEPRPRSRPRPQDAAIETGVVEVKVADQDPVATST